jgi:hypothetical protein
VCYRCWSRLPVVRGAAVEPCHQVAVGGAGGGYFVVAVLEVLPLVEELLFELGDVLTESADFVDSGKACVVEDLARPVAFRCVSRRFPTRCANSCPACVPLSRVMHVTLSMSAAARWLKECRCEPVHSSAREA